MKFRTEIEIENYDFEIEHKDKILSIGSCFAENISEYFRYYKFNIVSNPFGVLYNPISIFNGINSALSKREFNGDDLILHQGEYHSFYHHSDFSHHEKEVCLERINNSVMETEEFLKKADYLIISYGTSIVYKYKNTGEIVSNCHKIPAKEFQKVRLSLEEILNYISATVELIKKINSSTKIIFTVSPVRHWKDGAVENQLSKAGLLLGIDEIIKKNNNCSYFPSYEILMDDLRDYRFYDQDLVHPNKTAVDYIWKKFRESCISGHSRNIIDDLEKIIRAKNHRPRNIYSEEYKKFVGVSLSKIEKLEKKYVSLQLEEEKKYFLNQLEIIEDK